MGPAVAGGIGLTLCVVPAYLTAVLTHYAGALGNDVSALRTITVPSAFLVAGLVCVIVALVHSIPRPVRRWLPVVLFVAIPFSLVVSAQPILTVIRAEALRSSLLHYRDAEIRFQLVAHQPTIYVTPAPILLHDSQAGEFSYIENHQIGWLLIALDDYYGLRGKTVKVASSPPPGYCLTGSDASWWGAYTCQTDAAQHVPTVPYTLVVPPGHGP
jgi:hypothetical protein